MKREIIDVREQAFDTARLFFFHRTSPCFQQIRTSLCNIFYYTLSFQKMQAGICYIFVIPRITYARQNKFSHFFCCLHKKIPPAQTSIGGGLHENPDKTEIQIPWILHSTCPEPGHDRRSLCLCVPSDQPDPGTESQLAERTDGSDDHCYPAV